MQGKRHALSLLRISLVTIVAASVAVVADTLPDLVVTEICTVPSLVLPGEVVEIVAEIANHGTVATTAPFHCQLLVDGTEVARKPVHTGLAGSSTMGVSFSWRFSPGLHDVSVVADGGIPNILESNESNNSLVLSVDAGVTLEAVAPWLPDARSYTLMWRESFDAGGLSWWDPYKWQVEEQDGNRYLRGLGDDRNVGYGSEAWQDYAFCLKMRVESGLAIVGFRAGKGLGYGLHAQPGRRYSLQKETRPDQWVELAFSEEVCTSGGWTDVLVTANDALLSVFIDGELALSYDDREEPHLAGGVYVYLEGDCDVSLDNFVVASSSIAYSYCWTPCGGPLGGIGYDVIYRPDDPDMMFVTDAGAGIFKSFDAGETWVSKNAGILLTWGETLYTGTVPVFCAAIDSSNPDTMWIGTIGGTGIYKSADGGESWILLNNGVEEDPSLLGIRGFTIHPEDSNTVFMQAGVSTGLESRIGGSEKRRGVIYKTTDGGANWRRVWEGDSLARFTLINPQNSNIMYGSTGIFDYAAYNDFGVGVLKSEDGGESWHTANEGLGCLFVGYLAMHPDDPDVLLAATGNAEISGLGINGGVYLSRDGAGHWEEILAGGVLSVVAFAPSDPDVLYAASSYAVYRSGDGGATWTQMNKPNEKHYGPLGVFAGHPIGIAVHPENALEVYINNYGGGVFRSADGGRTWTDMSSGYTGAAVIDLEVDPRDEDILYANTGFCPFRSEDGGVHWEGIAFPPAHANAYRDIALNPADPDQLLLSGCEMQRAIFKSDDQGMSWEEVFFREEADQHVEAMAYAPSDPSVVYAGVHSEKRSILEERTTKRGLGMMKSTDGGETWRFANNGLEETSLNITCIAVRPDNPGIAYVGTLHDGVFKTMDGGANWLPASGGLRSGFVSSLAIDPLFPETVYAGLGDGVGIFVSTDGGEMWNSANQGLAVECPSYLARVGEVRPGISLDRRPSFLQYRSAPSWSIITSVVIDPTDNLVLYLSDYAVGVCVSKNGGPWTPINRGLTNTQIQDLAISADGGVLYAASAGHGVFRLDVPRQASETW